MHTPRRLDPKGGPPNDEHHPSQRMPPPPPERPTRTNNTKTSTTSGLMASVLSGQRWGKVGKAAKQGPPDFKRCLKSHGRPGGSAPLVGGGQVLVCDALGHRSPVCEVAIGSHHVVLVCAGNGWPMLTAELRQKVTGSTSSRSLGLVLDGPQNHTARHRHSV